MNKKHLTFLAKNLRNNQTDAEKKLWFYLRNKQILNVKFRRQQPIGNYIADLFSPEKKLIIEVDGGQHFESENDFERDRWFKENGYTLLRFWNNDVLQNIEGVLEVIYEKCK